MTDLPYNITDPQSILDYSRKLYGKTLLEVVGNDKLSENSKNKGNLGRLVESLFFLIHPGNDHAPDFKEAGVELKTTGLLFDNNSYYKAKERLVLTMINYTELANENFEHSTFLLKCRLMLLLFYLYERDTPVYNYRFVLEPLLFKFPEEDLEVIRRDWEFIQNKVLDGKAHELSEGDTFYLGACRKGSGGLREPLRQQPYSDVGAKARAFSLNQRYMNRIIDKHTRDENVFDKNIIKKLGIEKATQIKFAPYVGMSVHDIARTVNRQHKGKNDKIFYRDLAMRMLGVTGKRTIPELDKAGIEIKIIRLQKNGTPKESMSFPAFKYMDIINEDREESSFFEKLERKFLFVVFQYNSNDELHLVKAKYWNMPYVDRVEAQRVWEDTKRRVSIDAADLPKLAESPVAHVRPKAKNSKDTLPTPQGTSLIKKCFWLNRRYIAKQLTD